MANLPEIVNASMMEAALELLTKHECSVIPVGMNKKPLVAWEPYQHELPTEEQVEAWWCKWPNANIGLITGAVSGIVVIDCDSKDQSKIDWVFEHFGKTTLYVETARGYHFYYRHPGCGVVVITRAGIAPGIDIRGDGGYVVAPNSVHVSGWVYTWHTAAGSDGWGDMPTLDMSFFKKASTSATWGGGIDLASVNTVASTDPVEVGKRNQTLTQLIGGWIPQHKGDAETVTLLALGWNARLDQPLSQEEVYRTIKSVYDMHERNHPGDLELMRQGAQQADVKLLDITKEQKAVSIPDECLHPGGLMEAMMEYMEQTSAISNPVYNLAGAIVAMGTLAGQRVMTESRLRTNVYCVAVGVSGTGKDAPQSAIPDIFTPTRANGLLGANSFSSDSAVLRMLEMSPCSMVCLDEMGLLLEAIKTPTSPRRELPALLMQLFSSAGRSYTKSYADTKNKVVLKWHHLSLYGASTPDRFWLSLGNGEASDGFLARVLVFESSIDPQEPRRIVSNTGPSENLIAGINAIYDWRPRTEGNIAEIPHPLCVPKTHEADEYFKSWAAKYFKLRIENCRKNEFKASIYGRTAEHAHKLALVHAMSLHGVDIEAHGVGMDSVWWATRLMDAITANTIIQAGDNIAESDFERYSQRVVRTIKVHLRSKNGSGKPGVSRSVIEGKLKGVPSDMVEKVLKKLEAQKVLCKQEWVPQRGSRSTLFCLVESKEEE